MIAKIIIMPAKVANDTKTPAAWGIKEATTTINTVNLKHNYGLDVKTFSKCKAYRNGPIQKSPKVKKQDTDGLLHHNDAMTSAIVAELY